MNTPIKHPYHTCLSKGQLGVAIKFCIFQWNQNLVLPQGHLHGSSQLQQHWLLPSHI